MFEPKATAPHLDSTQWATVHCRRPINQGFIDLLASKAPS
jgi:hypothetical protein